jgi:6-phosphogluconolactonase
MKQSVRIFRTPYELADKFAKEMVRMIKQASENNIPVTVALSGGSTPELLFSILGDHFSRSAPWEFAHFFWGDERCVPPDSRESNFGTAFRSFFNKIQIPDFNIHRIFGEQDPVKEAGRYSDIISQFTRKRDGIPVFDLVLLGLGDDGHTASIFPDRPDLLISEKICEVSVHPVSNQKRITITGRIINNAENIRFLVTGKKKAVIVRTIINKEEGVSNFPASFIVPAYGKLEWLIDSDAGSLL